MITLSSKVGSALSNGYPLAWLVKITLDSTTKYFSSIPVTIDGVNYVGGYILKGGISELEEGMDILEGGGIDYIGAMNLTLNEIVTTPGLHSMISPFASDEWFNRKVEIGLIYNDGTSLVAADITWLYTGRIESANVSRSSVVVEVMDYNEIQSVDLPREIINSTDYPNAPKDNIGEPLPILYGYFAGNTAVTDLTPAPVTSVPTVCVDEFQNKYVVAGHVCAGADTDQYYFDSVMKQPGYLLVKQGAVYVSVTADTDDSGISSITIPTGQLIAQCNWWFSFAGDNNTITDFKEAINEDIDDEFDIPNSNLLGCVMTGLPNGEIDGSIKIYQWRFSSSSQNWRVGYYINGSYTNIATHTADTDLINNDSFSGFNGKPTTEFGKYEFMINAAAVGEAFSRCRGFYMHAYVYIKDDLKKEGYIVPRARGPRSGGPGEILLSGIMSGSLYSGYTFGHGGATRDSGAGMTRTSDRPREQGGGR